MPATMPKPAQNCYNRRIMNNKSSPRMNPVDREAFLALCKASADALRLDILRVLSRDSFGVLELCRIFATKQSGMSHHLKILANAGLVATRREGNSIFYRRTSGAEDSALSALQQALLATADRMPLDQAVQDRMQRVQQERAEQSRAFFQENADRFQQHQEQIVPYEVYGVSAAELLASNIRGKPARVLEIGPGEGAFLAELSPRFQQVYALDNSEQMLNLARRFADRKQLTNIHFVQGDTRNHQLEPDSFDCIVVNMVLHHVPSPSEIFADLASLLRPDGQLFVTELCTHDQNWVREACGDIWFGFEPQDLSDWADLAGLGEGQSIYLAQRNGFRVQIRQFIK